MDDNRIVELYWERAEQAITETAKKYGSYCYSIAYNILHNHEDAEEGVNDTYTDAWTSMPPHRPAVLSTFLGKITRRISIDKYRQYHAQKRGGGNMPLILDEIQECVASEETTEQWHDKQHLSAVMNVFATSLPEIEQRVFLCRYWYMDSVADICRRFGFSESKVKSMLYRTREKLRIVLEKEGFQ